jgi:hypothetical protein
MKPQRKRTHSVRFIIIDGDMATSTTVDLRRRRNRISGQGSPMKLYGSSGVLYAKAMGASFIVRVKSHKASTI